MSELDFYERLHFDKLLSELADARFVAQCSGLKMVDDDGVYLVDTTPASVMNLTAAQLAVQMGIREEGSIWKVGRISPTGVHMEFRPTSNEEITLWARLSIEMVQSCFDIEANYDKSIRMFVENGNMDAASALNYQAEFDRVVSVVTE